MQLWGPALDAEIEYRQSEMRKAWGGRSTDAARGDRAISTAERRAHSTRSDRSDRPDRPDRPDRAERIRVGIAGMRPRQTGGKGLLA